MTRKKVAIIHPDLGIGGAERLIIDAVLELIALNYDVSEATKERSYCTLDITVHTPASKKLCSKGNERSGFVFEGVGYLVI